MKPLSCSSGSHRQCHQCVRPSASYGTMAAGLTGHQGAICITAQWRCRGGQWGGGNVVPVSFYSRGRPSGGWPEFNQEDPYVSSVFSLLGTWIPSVTRGGKQIFRSETDRTLRSELWSDWPGCSNHQALAVGSGHSSFVSPEKN